MSTKQVPNTYVQKDSISSEQLLNTQFKRKKQLRWRDDNLVTIRYIEQSSADRMNERICKNFHETCELIRRFHSSVSSGGSEGNWTIFQQKIDMLPEPCWFLIGRQWGCLFGRAKRNEEFEIEELETENKTCSSIFDVVDEDEDNTVWENILSVLAPSLENEYPEDDKFSICNTLTELEDLLDNRTIG